jgi:class 3 adenylate cyclase
MSRCPECQHENPPGARFCNGCGARAELACAECGQVNPSGSRFCNGCGAKLGDPAPAGPQPRFASPESYTPKHLAEKILTSKAALEGERKQITVLFADLKGSMELLADRDPEEARKILDPVLEHMMEAVHRYEGTVNQVMGDGIMALFGAPLAHEDHAVRACYAALRMQESVKGYAERARRAHGVTVRIRVGLNSGEVVVRAIGSDLHMDYTAVGQTTHLAARMEQLAEPGSILLSPDTLALAEGYIEVKPLGPLPVKGLPAPVEVYELVGAGVVRSRLHAAAPGGLTRFVGRDSELDQLRRALERAQAGHGQIVTVVGEPGVGKSRLYWEFTHSHRARGWLVLECGSVSYGKATGYLPVIDLLKAYFHIEGRDETRTIREKVTCKVLSLDRALEPSLSALLSLLEVPVEDEAWVRLDPPQRRQQTLDAVKRLLLRESQVQPLLLLVEDLHWIDAETQALLDSLVESLPMARVLLLANYRPEYQHQWGSKTYYRQLRIDPLPAESSDDLLTSLLGTEPSLDSLKRTLIARTEGNPLFLEESVRALAETKALIGERGTYRLANSSSIIARRADSAARRATACWVVPLYCSAGSTTRGAWVTARFRLTPRPRPRLMPCICSATSRRIPISSMLCAARLTTGMRWRWPSRAACAHSSRTATSASASSTGERTNASRPESTSPSRPRCSARWTCGSGWSRRSRSRGRWREGDAGVFQPMTARTSAFSLGDRRWAGG